MKCPRCGSENIMPNLRIRDRAHRRGVENLEVEVEGNPDALLFKGAHREPLRANVCGECGNIELYVKNPKGLWETYSQREEPN